MQVVAAYSMAYPEADKSKIVPIVATVAVHVLILYGVAMSAGVVPALKYEPPIIVDFLPDPVKPELPKASLEKTDLRPFEFVPPQQDEPKFKQEVDIGPGEKTVGITGNGNTATLPPSPGIIGARLLRSSEPLYPSVSRIKGEAGTVVVRIAITPYGTVSGAEVEKSSGYPRLDEAALKAARLWKFAPAKRGNEAIASSMLVPVRFEMK